MHPHLPPLAALLLATTAAHGSPLDDVGYTRLLAELGENAPGGTAYHVTQVEGAVEVDDDGDPDTEPMAVWIPDTTHADFASQIFHDRSGSPPGLYSQHATNVGRRFFGTARSAAPEVSEIDLYLADHWLEQGVLRTGDQLSPRSNTTRISNHSWVADNNDKPGYDAEVLRRVDWLALVDTHVPVVGIRNMEGETNSALLAPAHNVISVGRSDGIHGVGTPAVDAQYPAGRARPHLVAPLGTSSVAAPLVAGAVTMLMETGADPLLSGDPHSTAITTRWGERVYNAARVETLRAILMAGADRATSNMAGGNLAGYRADPADRTPNGLDRRYGAGQLDVYDAWHIMTGGEQNSSEDDPAGGGQIASRGFDFDPRFGGADGSNAVATYRLHTGTTWVRLTASLSWLARVGPPVPLPVYIDTVTLHDLNLSLHETGADSGQAVARSASTDETSENLWLTLPPDRSYTLEVSIPEGSAPFVWRYALAWQLESLTDGDEDNVADSQDNCTLVANPAQRDTDADGYGNFCDADFDNDGEVGFNDLSRLRSEFFSSEPLTDLNGDGTVEFADLTLLKQSFFEAPGPSALAD